MSNKRYYWLKLPDDFFTQPKIKKLRKIAGGDTYTVIYLKMLLLAMKQDWMLCSEGIEEDFFEELALVLDEDPDNVKVTCNYLMSKELMVELNNDSFALINCEGMVGSESVSAARVRRFRENKKINPENLIENNEETLHCNAPVTQMKQIGNVEIEKEKEIEIDIDIDKTSLSCQRVFDLYNEICTSLPKASRLSEKRKKAIRSISKKFSEEEITKVFHLAQESTFLRGNNGTWGGANIDWLMIEGNFLKTLEGNYSNRPSSQSIGFHNFRERDYDYDDIAKRLKEV